MNPLLVQAQRKVLARIKQYEGPTPPQPHYKNAKKLTSKQYVTKQVCHTNIVGFFGTIGNFIQEIENQILYRKSNDQDINYIFPMLIKMKQSIVEVQNICVTVESRMGR